MKKILKVIRNILIGIIMVVYFAFIVAISTLLLNKNDYGVTQFGEKSLILVDDKISNKDYPEGTLVILETRKIEDLKAGDEVFIYQPDNKDKSVDIIISDIESVHLDVDSPYVKLTNDGTAWGEDFIAGTKVEIYPDLGAFLIFIESKWVFFILLIMPCFFILLYEIYLLIIAIKFDDEEDEVKEQVKTENTDSSDKLEDLARQLEELKKEAGEDEPKAKEENIDDLMAQLNSLRKEYDDIGSSTDKTEIIEIEKDEVQEAIEQSITEVIPVVTEKVIEQIEEEKVEVAPKQVEKTAQQNNSNKQNNNRNNNNRNNNNRNNNRNNQNNRNNNNRNNNNRNNQNNRNNNRNNNNRNNQNNRNNNRNNNNRNNQKRK